MDCNLGEVFAIRKAYFDLCWVACALYIEVKSDSLYN
jgi:hypothetical protein